jgi:uncharacterized repeat protein (TIGR03899 family)
MSNSIDQNKIIEHPAEQSKPDIVEHDEQTVTPKNNAHANVNASSQKQLLVLAKKFSLSAAFSPETKQVPLEERANRRKKLDQLRKQQNMEAIIVRAVQYCSDETITDRADQDWFSSFLTLAESISNKNMQDLWAKILAGEVSQPGCFSLKTLQAFRTMSITEAKLLAKACSVAMTDARKKNIRIISGAYQISKLFNLFNKQRQQRLDLNQVGLSYADILTLADNHLMFEQETESHSFAKGEKVQFNYHGKKLSFVAKKSDCILTFYKFTPIGTELAHLVTDDENEHYLTLIKTQLAENFAIDS